MSLTKASYSMISGAPINVFDFGATGDGTTNDTAAIQAAIDSMSAGDELYFPSGDYLITGNPALTFPSSLQRIRVYCDGRFLYNQNNVAIKISDSTTRMYESKFFNLSIKRAYSSPYETGLAGTGFSIVNNGDCEFNGFRAEGFEKGIALEPNAVNMAVTINTFFHCSTQACTHNIFLEAAGDTDNCYVTANVFIGGYQVTDQTEFTNPVTSNAALVYLSNPYRLTRSGNTVDGNRFYGMTIEQPVHRKIYCEGNSNSWTNCYFDTGTFLSGNPNGTPLNTKYPFYNSSGTAGFATVAGSNVLTKAAHGLDTYVSVGDYLGVLSSTNISDSADYVVTAIDANTITINKNLASNGTASVTNASANIEFTATANNNSIIDSDSITYQCITSVSTSQTNKIIGGRAGYVFGPLPQFGGTNSTIIPFGFNDAQTNGSLNIVGTTPNSSSDQAAVGVLGSINNVDVSDGYILKFVGLDANARMSAYAAIQAFKEGRNTSTAYGGLSFLIRQNTTNEGLVKALTIDSSKNATFYGSITPSGTGCIWGAGAGSPEGVITGPIGSLYTRTDGGVSTTLYVKTSGTGNTGWTAK